MIPLLIFIAIVAMGVLIYMNNKVENRRIDRSNRLAEKHEELIRMLQEKAKQETNSNENDTTES